MQLLTKLFRRFLLISLFILLYQGPVVFAQNEGDTAKYMVTEINEKSTSPTLFTADIFRFENINKVGYYQDPRLQKKIRKFLEQEEYRKAYDGLREYVGNFGIRNFYRDTEDIWRLAKLTEMLGDSLEALLLYKLVLKHHRDNIELAQFEIYYDSISQNQVPDYVPLDYYYELVEYRREVDTLIPPRGVYLNMGTAINSDFEDYGPTLSQDDEMLIFSSKRNQKEHEIRGLEENEDLFFSKKTSSGYYTRARPFESINTRFNEGSACLSRNGKTLYFSRCNTPDGYGSCDLYVAQLQEDSTWGNIKNLGLNVNSKAWDSHPSLSHSEDTLFFASDRLGGFGLSDIYMTYKQKNGDWSRAYNLGPIVNSRNSEVSPFYHPIYEILYFSSTGHLLNFGDFDIYKTYHLGKQWTEPQNIGPLVNGSGSEYYFTIDSRSSDLYYARSEEKNMKNLDLYSFPLPMTAQPLATTRVTGSVKDSVTGSPLTGIVSIIDLEDGIEVAPQFLRADGTFAFDLINNKDYLLVIQSSEFFRIEEVFFLDGETNLEKETRKLASKIKFETVEFEENQAELKPDMYADLDKVIDFLIDNPGFRLKIGGHTDSDGSHEFNLNLSKERAKTIREYIVVFGNIDPNRIQAEGYGSTQPIVEERTEADKRLNRRVEFELYRPSSTEDIFGQN